ncbi:MAG: prolyl oligopeptidase family serine peptidase [Pseudomonadota bacterium]|nr:prolyl oligopeptidase family serine peptidase [Pseudomonadota bacterium]
MTSAALNQNLAQAPWIAELPEDFYRRPQQVKAPFDPGTSLTALVDLAIRTGLSAWMAGISFPSYPGASLAQTLRGEHASHRGSDAQIFHQPRPMPTFTVTESTRPKGVEGGVFEQVQWRSVYEAINHQSHQNNDEVVAWYWRHGDKPRPTVILVHGFLAPWWEVNDFYLGSHFLYHLGCDVILKTLPHHGPRSRRAKNVSGMDFMSRGIDALNHAVVQSTYDIRTLVDFLQSRAVDQIGITGVSLGGYTTALMAGLEDRFQFAIPLVPLISLPDAMMEWKPLDTMIKGAMRWYKVSMQEVRATTAFHSPLSRPALLPAERLLIIGGLGDKLATPRHSEALQQHWGQCALHWHPGAHALPRQQQHTNQVKKAFLQDIGFID